MLYIVLNLLYFIEVMKSNEKLNKTRNIHCVLFGDSVLDNFYWLKNKKHDSTYKLTQVLKDSYHESSKCTNLALDESRTVDVINGKVPGFTYVNERKNQKMSNYLVDHSGLFKPIDLYKEIRTIEPYPSHIILSIGGNDANFKLIDNNLNLDKTINDLLHGDFLKNYQLTIDKLLEMTKFLILVNVYLPGPGFTLPLDDIKELYRKIFPCLYKEARKRGLPVIDLSRTFNPNDFSHYGSSPIEPSNLSCDFIVNLIVKIINKFDFNKGVSHIYYGIGNEIKIEENTEDYEYII